MERDRESWETIRNNNQGTIACRRHAIAVKRDGAAVTTDKSKAAGVVRNWTDLTAVAAGEGWFAGLKADGTVVVTDRFLQEAVAGWRDISQIAAGVRHIVGLRADGRVFAAGDDEYGQCDVGDWEGILEIAAGDRHTVGRKEWGIVLAVGDNGNGQCAVGDRGGEWSDIAALACGPDCTVTMGGYGDSELYGNYQWDYGSEEIAALFSGRYITGILASGEPFCACAVDDRRQQWRYEDVFREWEWSTDEYRSDLGAIRAAYDVSGWRDVIALSCGYAVTLGLCEDGTVKAAFARPCGYPGRSAYFEEPAFSPADIADWKELRVVLPGREEA